MNNITGVNDSAIDSTTISNDPAVDYLYQGNKARSQALSFLSIFLEQFLHDGDRARSISCAKDGMMVEMVVPVTHQLQSAEHKIL
jgi:hypothetical protein